MSALLPSREEVLEVLTRQPMTTSQLRGYFNITKKHKLAFKAILLQMVEEGVLGRNERKEYVVGKTKHKTGDEVWKSPRVREEGGSGRPASRSRRRENQPSTSRVHKGMLFQENNQWMVRDPISRKTYRIPNRKRPPGTLGQMVVFELYPHPKYKHEMLAKIISSVEGFGTFKELARQFQEDNDLPFSFPADVEKEIASMQEPGEKDFSGRKDYRHLSILCIDPKGARDHDDAVSIEKIRDGWMLGVHIADVSYYVKEGGALDNEALERSFTQYLPWTAVPMLPEKLSADLCSLNEGVDRLAFTCMMKLDAQGRVVRYAFERSVIRVTRSITYEEAMELYERKDPEVLNLCRVARLLKALRIDTGLLELGSPEYGVEFDERGEPVKIIPRANVESNSWIEECMLIANQCCAKELVKRKLQGIFRVHEPPDVKDVLALRESEPELFTKMPVSIQELMDARRQDSNLHAPGFKLYQYLVEQAHGNDAKINRILRSMQKAHYDSNPFGHWALNWQDYAHFTSPIRRYADLWCHRELARDSRSAAKAKRAHDVVEVCDLISANEVKNQKIERSAIKVCAAWMLRERIGDEFPGTINGMEEWGIFVSLDDPPCDGLVRFRDLPGDDFWFFNREKGCVVGRRSRRAYYRGDRVLVQVLKVNPLKGEVDLAIVSRLDSSISDSGQREPKDGDRRAQGVPGRGGEPEWVKQKQGKRSRRRS